MTTAEQLQRIESRLRGAAAERASAERASPDLTAVERASEGRADRATHRQLEPIAIVGVAGFFPGCRSVREFWRALEDDRCLLEEIPRERFDWEAVYDPTGQDPRRSHTKWGGFIPDVRGFDPDFFKIAHGAADLMDPRQRLLLMSVYHALDDAGWAPAALRASRTGVFVAAEDNEYLELLRARDAGWGDGLEESPGMIANRISHHFDFRGPSEYINTLCSGGAVALHRAVQSLRAGEIGAAIVGAANVILRPEPFVQMSRLGQLSPTCSVRSFGREARGHLRSEAVVSVVLKPLARAEAEGDVIYALIKHSAVNHSGRGSVSLTTPDPAVHADLIRGCVEAAGVDPRNLGYIEAQGMGNALSDLAEWRAFNLALQALAQERGVTVPPGNCFVGTLKPLAGHMEAASSLAALCKVIHGLQTQRIFGIHGFAERNEELNTDGQPCQLATSGRLWRQNAGPRLAGLHAHGLGGNNAHVLVEEYVSRRQRPQRGIGQRLTLVVLSAPTEHALAQRGRDLLDWLERHPDADLAELAFTSQVGRDAFEHRLALVVHDIAELARGLSEFAQGRQNARVFHGRARAQAGDGGPSDWNDLAALARFWTNGGSVAWADHCKGRRVQRVSLPGYPFELQPCWFDRTENGPATLTAGEGPSEDEVRRRLIALVAEELKLDHAAVEPEKHFIEHGIDSLTGLRLAQRLGRSFGTPVSLRDWLDHPSVEAYSRFFATRIDRTAKSQAAMPDPARKRNDRWPLSECQRGLWALQKTRPETVAYNVPIAIQAGGRLDRERLEGAARSLLSRHAVLASRIQEEAGELWLVPSGAPVHVEETELRTMASAEIEGVLAERLRRPFDLEQGPLIRFHLLHQAEAGSILLLAIHHLVVDGLSTAPILETLHEAYATTARRPHVMQSEPRVGFGDFVRGEKVRLEGPAGERLKTYWREQLAGELPALQLFAERPNGMPTMSNGGIVTVPLDRVRSKALVDLARTLRITPATVFLGLFQTLLHRYSGLDDLIVGVPTQVRPDERFAGEVGYFLNVLPIRGRNLAEHSFADLAQSLQRTLADAIDHAAYPFPRMVRDLGLTSSEEMNPLVQVAFEFQNLESSDSVRGAGPGARGWIRLEKPRQTGEYDLVLEVVEFAARFDLHFKFDGAHHADEGVRRFAEHFCALAASVAARPDLIPGERAMLGEAETRQLLHEWNATQRDFPRDACVHELIERQAQATPDAIAIRFEERTMTYRELDERSEALARYLQHIGVGPDAPVAIFMERSPEMTVGLLAILKAGGAYVPLDATYPVDRLAFMAKDSRAAVILTETRLRAGMAPWLAQSQNGILRVVVEIDGERAQLATNAAKQAARERRVTADRLAYVIYTSGSTGVPKGVMIPHRALVNLLVSMSREPGLRREDRLLAVTTLSFDIAGLELFLPLIQGAECCLASSRELADAETLKQAIRRIRPTVMQATPSTWRSLLHADWRNEERVRILCGGEALPDDLAKALVEGGVEAWNMYGPTETTIWSTASRIQSGVTGIGRPIANTRVYVVDRKGNPLPAGVAGELVIGGEGLARGYWQRPELTAERFVKLPFLPGERLYRTGDLACWRPDGTLHCLGRTDHQVKVRGHRIELGEIETQLGRHPGVRDCAVIVRENAGAQQIVAFYIAAGAHGNETAATTEALQAHLRRHLPVYMIPALFVRLDALPLTLNGKKDRKALLARRIEAPRAERPTAAPTSELEAVVLQIWRELLRVENLRATDVFFEVGGDSVSAVMVAARISRQLAVPFTVTDLFRCATPRAICADVGRKLAAHGAAISAPGPELETAKIHGAKPGMPDYYQDSLAIIGMSCRFPGADDHRAFWANLRAGVDSGVRVSPEELRRAGVPERLRENPDFVPLLMTIAGKDEFDPDFFSIPTKNAGFMDPQFRLLLMHAWKAIEDAGYTPKDLGEAGVYMSVSNTLYASALLDTQSDMFDADNYVAWLMAQEGSVATMISYQLGLRGPSYAVHANCASSLVALHAAYQSLRAGDARCALVGAASVLPATAHGYLNRKGLNFASDGRCRAFDAAADGTIAGEGLAVLVVKRASDAVADGDHIYALVRGVGVTNDGAEKVGFYAPGVDGHAAAIEKALRLTGVERESISYVEAHGTGTKLGDPVEVAALTQAYHTENGRVGPCGLGSVKTNIGHLDTAAGLAGCIKVALSLQQREIPPTLHFQKPNPELKLEQSPFHVVDRLRPWTQEEGPRRAGLSSLGIGGTNAHAILEEWVSPAATFIERPATGPCLVVLSAADNVRLREMIENLLRFLRSENGAVELTDLAYTLQVGRVPMAARVALIVTSTAELIDKLAVHLAGGTPVIECWAGSVPAEGGDLELLRDDDAAGSLLERWLAEHKLAQLAQFWVRGGSIDWRGLHRGARPRRVSLPTYSFAREQFRPPEKQRDSAAVAAPGDTPFVAGMLHPLLHENRSTLGVQCYRTTLTGREFFLADHVVRGERLLPAVAYLEMARAAVTHATGGTAGGYSLRNIAWVRPLAVSNAARDLEITLRASEEGDGGIRFEISAAGEATGNENESESLLLCQGAAVRAEITGPAITFPGELRTAAYPKRYDAERCYGAFRQLGVEYGPAHRGIVELFARENQVLARLALPSAAEEASGQFILHPALLDAAVHASIGFYLHDQETSPEREMPLLLPFALEEVTVVRALPRAGWTRITRRPDTGRSGEAETLDIDVLDTTGTLCVRLRGFFSHAVSALKPPVPPSRREVWLMRPNWKQSEPSGQPGSGAKRAFGSWKVLLCGVRAPAALLVDEGLAAEWIDVEIGTESALNRFTRAASAVFRELKTILESKPRQDILVQVVVPRRTDTAGFEGISGLLRTAGLEQPRLFAQLISVEDDIDGDALVAALQSNRRDPAATEVRHRAGRRFVLSHRSAPRSLPLVRPWRTDGIYLITGGGGALAWIFAKEILRHAAGARIILVGRSAPNADLTSRIERARGRIEYRQTDVSRPEAVDALISSVRADAGGLRGVIHAAGVIDDAFILQKSPEAFAAVLAPKVAGAFNLDAALGTVDLDFFALFSSLAGGFGSVGQADYATANGFLDAFAEQRQEQVSAGVRKGRTVSIAWPLWREGGMRTAEAIERAQEARTGFLPMPTDEGLDAFYQALALDEPRVAVFCGERRRIETYLESLRDRPPLAEPREQIASDNSSGLASAALEFLRATVAKTLERPAHRIKDDEKFERYGLDSILAVELTNRLEQDFGSLPKTLFFEYPSLGELRDYFVQHHQEKLRVATGFDRVAAPAAVEQRPLPSPLPLTVPRPVRALRADAPVKVSSTPRRPAESSDIAIIGLTGRYPLAADLAEFWANLKAGRDGITEVPADRWDWRDFDPAERGRPELAAGKWGGFIEGVDRFDPLLFNMAPREADLVDPQERLFLETVWNLLETTGHTRENMRERYQGRVAVYAASMYQHYHAFRSDVMSEALVSLSSFSGIANRVSYFFDFHGPSVAVDTMCSSSIVAIQMACDCLRNGEALCAIAGGVNLSLHYKKFLGLTASKLMGTRAESRSFAEGDGYLPAEGVGAVLLKPLAQAIEDGDAILGVIKAATTNHSGQSGGFAVPNPKAQAEALVNCLVRAGVDPRTVTYVESAANGSPLGDSIEIKALRAAFAADVAGGATRRVGSVKSNIGHAEAASGMAQLAKVILQLRHRQLVPTIKARPLNPNLDLAGAPFRLQEELEEWKRPVVEIDGATREFPLRAVVQSVGAGGSSAHLVLEEYRDDAAPAVKTPEADRPRLIVLSARTRERLTAMADNLRRHAESDTSLRVSDVAHTLLFGREAMDHRAALVVRSRDELRQGLADLVVRLRDGNEGAGRIPLFIGDVEAANPAVRELFAGPSGELILQQWIATRALEKLGAWWTQGGEIPWAKLDDKPEGRVVPLPTYPFERRRCWIRESAETMQPVLAAEAVRAESLPENPVILAAPAAAAPNLKTFLQARIGELLGLAAQEVSTTKVLNTLGFSSLDAVNLKSKLEQAFAIEVPLATLNAYQTINRIDAELSPQLAGKLAESPSPILNVERKKPASAGEIQPVVVPNPAERHRPFPLSDIQESFFAGRKLGSGADRAGCHIYFEIEVPGLDVYRLNAAWNRLLAHHEMLRAVFLADGTQRILDETPSYRIKVVDLRRMTGSEGTTRFERIRESMSHRIYDPEQWPLFDVSVSLLPDRRVIHFSIDELIVDAASIDVLFQHWHRLYEKPDERLAELELSFRDYVLATRRFTATPRYAKDLEYWVNKLRKLPPGPVLPGSREVAVGAGAASRRCARFEATLTAHDWSALKRRAEAMQVSPTALLLGLFTEVLRSGCDEKTFSLILTFFNRLPIHPQVEQLLGPLISTSIFLADEIAEEDLPDRLQRTQRALWNDLDHSSVSGIAVLRELGRRRLRPASVALPVVFTSMLGNRNTNEDTLFRHLTYSVTQTPQVYLDHQLYEERGELRFSWDVVKDYFAPGLVETLFETYVQLLQTLASRDDMWMAGRWRDIVSLTESQREATPTPPTPPTSTLQVRAHEQSEPFPLTDQQQAYAYGRSAHGGGKGANVYLEIDAAQLDVPRLEAAWTRLIAAHPMLRTTIRGDGRQQVRVDVPSYVPRVEDFAGLNDTARRDALAVVAREMSARVCPLDSWPYFELRVSRLPDGAARLHLCIDMIIADGASIDCLTQELLDLYAGRATATEWRPPAVTFRDYVLHLRDVQQSPAHAASLRYWNEKFADIPAGPELPRAERKEGEATHRLAARQGGWELLRRKAAELQVAPGMILLAAFVDVLRERAARKAFTIVIPCWERPALHPDIGRVVGDFTAMSWLVVRERAGTFAERVVQTHRAVHSDLAHGAASGLRVLRKLGARKSAQERVSFPVVFTNLSPQPPLRLPTGLQLGNALSQTPHVDLDNMTAEHGDEVELCWDVASGVHPAGLMEAMFADYCRIIAELAQHAEAWDRADVLAAAHAKPPRAP